MKNMNRSPIRLLLLAMGMLLTMTAAHSARAQNQPHGESRRETASPVATTIIYVTGAVRSPARLEFSRSVRLTEALCCVGGLLPENNSKVRIYRGGTENSKVIHINLKAIKKRSAEDLILQPYDIVVVASRNRHGGHITPIPILGELPSRKVN